MPRFRHLLPAFLLLLAFPRSSGGQSLGLDGLLGFDGASSGVPAFSFLKLPVSARNIGLASRTLTTDEEASMVHGNPASLALVADYFYSLSHAEILGEFRHEDLALAFPTPGWGGFGLGVNLLSATPFEDARDIDEEKAEPKAYDADLSLAYGKLLLEGRLAAGARLDLIRSAIDDATAHAYAVSFGALFFLIQDWRLGAAVQNLSHGVRYAGPDAPLEPLPMLLAMEVGKPLLGSRWSAHLGAQQGNEGIARWYGGGELRLLKHVLLRMGWEGTSQDREIGGMGGFAAGTGFKYDRLTIDYGFKSLGILGAYHAVTLNYSRKANFRAADEVYLEKAIAKQRKGKYASALGLARKAVAANPYNFKAQALAKQLQLEIDRLEETAFSLIFTGGTDGVLTSQWRDGRALGGMARRKTKLVELDGMDGKSLIVDAGNLTHAKAFEGADAYVYAAYDQMPYDAINVGFEDWAKGPATWGGGLPWMSSQRPLDRVRAGLLADKTLSLKGGTQVLLMGALDPEGLRMQDGGAVPVEAVSEAVRRVAGLAGAGGSTGKNRRILILLLQGGLQTARKVAASAPELDVIVVAGDDRALGSPMKVGNTLLCSPGRGGTHIGHLTLTLDGKGGGIKSFRHLLIPLNSDIAEDPGIRRLLAPVTLDPNKWSLDDYDEDYRAQVMAYVRADGKGKTSRIVLRDLLSDREYPLPPAAARNTRPILGYGKNKVAFLGQDHPDGPREIYSMELGTQRLDTLTRDSGQALDIRWILGNNALLAAYGKAGSRDLWRIDPWSRERRNLSEGRFGDVTGFDIDKSGERLAVMGGSDGQSTIWVTSPKMEEPQAVAADKSFLGSPRWNPAGDRLAFLAQSGAGGVEEAGAGELRVFDFREKKLIPVTLGSRVRDFSWSADGKKLYYVAGVNLLDVNEYSLDSLVVRKVTEASSTPRSEEAPTPKVMDGRDGLLFESTGEDGRRSIRWVDLKTREEKSLADSSAANSLR